ncbi:MAG: putative sulfate/molybdate transporter [Elusimicrobiota bacterium]
MNRFRGLLGDVLGAFGDAGVLVPIFLALVALNGLPPARALILVGLTYLAAGAYFRLPVPVQPLKAMSAIAIAAGLDMFAIRSAAVWMGLILVTLSWTGTIERIAAWFTRPIVKGIQLGVGLLLLKSALMLAFPAAARALHSTAGTAPHGVLGFLTAFWVLVLPQIPLTLGNSVFATADAARGYFGEGTRADARRLSLSVGAANLAAGLLGGMPVCHGSGGLTAHYRCGARTARATALTGGLCLALGLLCGDGAAAVLRAVPSWALALLLVYVGLCHVWLVKGLAERRALALAIGAIGLLSGNLAVAMGCGLLLERVCDGLLQPRLAAR